MCIQGTVLPASAGMTKYGGCVYTVSLYAIIFGLPWGAISFVLFAHHAIMPIMRYIGIDYGEKRVGIALSDPDGKIAFPNTTLENHGIPVLLKEIRRMAKKENASVIVIGLPMGLEGKETAQTGKTRVFGERLEDDIWIPVEFENEMLTTRMAHQSGAKDIDASSAAIMLQSYLDKKGNNPS